MILSTRIKRLVRLTMPLHDCLLASTWNMNILMLWFITISFMNIPQCNFLNILSNVYLIRTILHQCPIFEGIKLEQIYFCISCIHRSLLYYFVIMRMKKFYFTNQKALLLGTIFLFLIEGFYNCVQPF